MMKIRRTAFITIFNKCVKSEQNYLNIGFITLYIMCLDSILD